MTVPLSFSLRKISGIRLGDRLGDRLGGRLGDSEAKRFTGRHTVNYSGER